jgi:hypothetical protein
MQQRVLLSQAECRDQVNNGFPNRMAPAPQRPIVARGVARQRHSARFEDLQPRQCSLDLFRHEVVTDALQHFAEDDIRQAEALAVEFGVEPVSLRISDGSEIIEASRAQSPDP